MLLAVVVGVATCPPGRAVAQETGRKIQVGLVNSLFPGSTQSLIDLISSPLQSLMKMQTGYVGDFSLEGEAFELAEAINSRKVHLGVFHGHEYGWVKSRYPDLVPLVVPVKNSRLTPVCLVVQSESKFNQPADLKGKRLEIPYQSKGYIYLFLERKCCLGGEPEDFFRKIRKSNQPTGVLSSLLDGYTQAAVVEKDDLDAFLRSNPSACDKLRILLQSEPFPPGVLVYKKGELSEEAIRRFREGMIKAHEHGKGRALLGLCRLRGFEPVPEDFDQMLTNIIASYPPPAGK